LEQDYERITNKGSVDWQAPSGLVRKECYGRSEWFLEEKQLSCPKIVEPAASTTDTQISIQ
jgi:hypothetical protein